MLEKTFVVAAALALTGPWAAAQTVWRCGSSYGQQPCAGGMALPASGKPTPAEAAAAARVAHADARLAQQLEKARLAQERNAPKAIVIGPQAAASAPVAGKERGKAKAGKPEQFSAVDPGEKRKKRK